MRVISRVGCIVASLIVAVGVAVPAHAAPDLETVPAVAGTLTTAEEAELDAALADLGINAATRASLVEKFDAGQPWDSMTGTSPVSTVTTTVDLMTSTRMTFADGSVVETDVSGAAPADSGISPMSVGGCREVSAGSYGAYYYDCVADVNLGYIRMGFTFDWSLIQYDGARIFAYRNGFHHLIGGSISDLEFVRQSASAVRYTGTATLAGGWFSGTVWMQANVSGTGAWTTSN